MFSPSRFDLKESNIERLFLVLVFSVSILSFYSNGLSLFSSTVFLIFSICLYLLWPLGQEVISSFIWNPDGEAFLVIDSFGEVKAVSEVSQLIRLPFLICLKVQVSDRAQSDWILVWCDCLEDSQWRKLNALARFSPLISAD